MSKDKEYFKIGVVVKKRLGPPVYGPLEKPFKPYCPHPKEHARFVKALFAAVKRD